MAHTPTLLAAKNGLQKRAWQCGLMNCRPANCPCLHHRMQGRHLSGLAASGPRPSQGSRVHLRMASYASENTLQARSARPTDPEASRRCANGSAYMCTACLCRPCPATVMHARSPIASGMPALVFSNDMFSLLMLPRTTTPLKTARGHRHLAPPWARSPTCLDWRTCRPQSHLITMLTGPRARDAASPAQSIDSLDEALLGLVFVCVGEDRG